MLFQNLIFIHIPKTGGNSVQKILSLNGNYQGEFLTNNSQDGINRFGIQDSLTSYKHQKLSEYEKVCTLSNYTLLSVVRNPTERLLSYFFSPSRHIKPNSSLLKIFDKLGIKSLLPHKYKSIKFVLEEFLEFIQNVETQTSYLSIGDKLNDNVNILKFENLNNELKYFLEKHRLNFYPIHLNKKINTTDHQNLIDTFNLEERIKKTKHIIDYRNFYNQYN